MKVVILAGGLGTRISEESRFKPKPLIEIDDKPILWHIMKIYSLYGFNDFIICGGYKQNCIKEFFFDLYINNADVTFDLRNNSIITHHARSEPWKVTVVDTGLNTMTGGRIKRIREYVGNNTFMVTYGDGVSDIDIGRLVEHHKAKNKLATITAIMPGGRFGTMEINDDDDILSFIEKKKDDGKWINGGFMVLEPEVFDYVEGDDTVFEKAPLENLAKDGQLTAYKHHGFWQCMDSMKEREYLQKLIATGEAPWIRW
ncbi:MAG: glucose-1-phosphate cytidylyltransferase [Candidatus Methanomethylophilaceae archaeon]|nr:glucose-1-phosphate cytidylyltransferase [Candidatus Methanomethylophilaceae archaeon]